MMTAFAKKTIKDIELHNKIVLLRADYNVPINSDGTIHDDYRIKGSIETIKYLLEQGSKVVICSHLGRPNGKRDKQYSLDKIAKHLEKLLKHDVDFIDDCIGPKVKEVVKKLKKGQVLLLENLRFYPGEESNDKEFAKELASLADVFVQDGFGVVHRAHASTEAITHLLPSVAGLLIEKEVTTITTAMNSPKRPLMAIVGGAKIADKIEIIETFIKSADILIIGGAMANTFLLARGIKVGESLVDRDEIDQARELIKKAKAESAKRHFVFYMPQDAVVADDISKNAKTRIVDWDAHVIASIENYPKEPPADSDAVGKDEKILDIGPFSGAFITGAMQTVNTVIWNGTLGVAEIDGVRGPVGPFSHGTELVVEGMLGEFGHRPYTIIGGGDTAAYIEKRDLIKYFNHVSTGGGASLDLIAGRKLPGIEALLDKTKSKNKV